MLHTSAHDIRRASPRIEVEALCWEIVDDRELSSLVVDLSRDGARLERPYVGGRIAAAVPLQLEVPEIDEVIWARGEVVFDQLVPMRAPSGGPFGFLRRTGYRIALAAARDLRMLRDYVYEKARARDAALAAEQTLTIESMLNAACYARG
jgi:hypothetical protein